jgi:hypothetical protein
VVSLQPVLAGQCCSSVAMGARSGLAGVCAQRRAPHRAGLLRAEPGAGAVSAYVEPEIARQTGTLGQRPPRSMACAPSRHAARTGAVRIARHPAETVPEYPHLAPALMH